ncbi:MAG: hypothetical protein KBC35_03415 [Candidatus Pacebacteria bacterium]|nr:hypothetical protein [Candidatus Paceibacterota bacterium]
MKRRLGRLLVLGSLILEIVAFPVSAAVPATYTNDNFFTSEHDAPVSFEQDALGNFTGMTVSGKLFYQTNITNSLNIRLQRFSIDEAFFYISDRGMIVADTDTIALSIYLSRMV